MEVGDHPAALGDDDDIAFAHEVGPVAVDHQPSCIRRRSPSGSVFGAKNHRRETGLGGGRWHIAGCCGVLVD